MAPSDLLPEISLYTDIEDLHRKIWTHAQTVFRRSIGSWWKWQILFPRNKRILFSVPDQCPIYSVR